MGNILLGSSRAFANGTESNKNSNNSFNFTSIAMFCVTFPTSLYISYKLYNVLHSIYFEDKLIMIDLKKKLAQKLRRPELEDLDYTMHELNIARDVIFPDDIDVNFSNIGGMGKEIEEVHDNIILPMKYWKQHRGADTLVKVPSGLLLYGRPGTGKSMMAKAIAKECDASFIALKTGTLLDKYVGESDKLVHAIFSLAQKIAPTVIFIDEIDTLLKKRESMNTSNSVHSTMLGSLMSEWDGISNDNKTPVIVLGATNRPADIDSAFLRRMPFQIKTLAPDLTSRVDILKKMIYFNKYSVDSSVDLVQLAVELEGYTGSDIKELLRVACVHRMKNIIKDVKSRMNNDDQQTQQSTAVSGNKASTFQEPMIINSTVLNSKPLTAMDFQYALEKAVRDGGFRCHYDTEINKDENNSIRSGYTDFISAVSHALAHNNNNNSSSL